eukprot:15433543-Alexandrium_andersonii.AAC.1
MKAFGAPRLPCGRKLLEGPRRRDFGLVLERWNDQRGRLAVVVGLGERRAEGLRVGLARVPLGGALGAQRGVKARARDEAN